MQDAARALGQWLVVLNGGSDESIEAGFAAPSSSGSVRSWSAPIRFSTKARSTGCAGGAASGAGNLPVSRICIGRRSDELWRQHHGHVSAGGTYVGRVLKGEKPVDLPVMHRPSSSS